MLVKALVVAHIIVLGYWLGSELVINSTFRYVTRARELHFAERERLLDHVMNVDQHVRYALALQLGLGLILASLLGYLPGGTFAAVSAAIVAASLLALIEATHRRRKLESGAKLAKIDRLVRYGAIVFFAVLGMSGLAGSSTLPLWLAIKMLLFAAAIACGLGIRVELTKYFNTWDAIRSRGSSADLEETLYRGYHRATRVLIGLWIIIAAITLVSLLKP